MSDNVHTMPGVKPPSNGAPSAALIGACRSLLAMAESGELQSFIGVGFVTDGKRAALWADNHPNVYEMMGSIAWLQHEYAQRHIGETA